MTLNGVGLLYDDTGNGGFVLRTDNTTANTTFRTGDSFTVQWNSTGTMNIFVGGESIPESADSIIDRHARELAERRPA